MHADSQSGPGGERLAWKDGAALVAQIKAYILKSIQKEEPLGMFFQNS